MRLASLFVVALLAFAGPAMAAPTLQDVAWLSGRWAGEGLGGQVAEGWADPAHGQMAGYFTLTKDGKPVFHEMMLLEEHEGGLRLRVKHFNPDFTGWEEKDASVDFKFVSVSKDELIFTALTFRREGPDAMVLILRLKDKDGAVREEIMRYRRLP